MYRNHFFSDRMIGSQIYNIEMIEIVIVIAITEKYRDRIAILFLMIDSNTVGNVRSLNTQVSSLWLLQIGHTCPQMNLSWSN